MLSIKRFSAYLILLALLQICVAVLNSCNEQYRNKSHENISVASIERGKELAAKYCQSCHSLPDPASLDATTWEKGVLPVMGPQLGVFEHNFQHYPSLRNDKYLDKNAYPSKPMLTKGQWQNIIDYYTATSPDTLEKQNRKKEIEIGLSLFTVQQPAINYTQAITSFVSINPVGVRYPLVVSDAFKNKTYFLNKDLSVADSFSTSGPTVGIEFRQNDLLCCNIGMLHPNNGKFGKGQLIHPDKHGKYKEDGKALIDSLLRPVQISSADFNRDGKQDYLVCEFGFATGALSWLENTGAGYKRHVIKALPGAIKAYIEDANKDGLADIWVLFAQGLEGIYLYINNGDGKFNGKEVLSFPPVYGSSFFELVDFNRDGLKDIVYTCGDNADYSKVLKPYHGVYIFLNKGGDKFEQTFFFPINGCYKALARDYDKDGDLDIAAIAFFADYQNQPEESFVYLRNDGDNKFHPSSFLESKNGRWLTMDAGDIDGDGLTDLVLGNFAMDDVGVNTKTGWAKSPPFIVLKNTGK